jgi:signal transduction histidine kinase/CheY-like chemotaxis protein
MTLLAAGAAVLWLGPLRAGLWLGAVLAIIPIGAGILVWIDTRRTPRPGHEVFLALWTAFYTAVYCTLPLQLMGSGTPTAIVAACAMMGAIAISSTAEFVHSRLVSIAALTSMAVTSLLAIAMDAGRDGPLEAALAGVSALCFFCYVLRFALARERGQLDLSASLDMARAKEAEAAAANAAKSVFLATMSHEIRTPLNGVLGMAGVMEMGELSPIQRERLTVIRQSGEALTTILNDVLDLSKIEAGKLQLELIEFDLAELLKSAGAPFAMLARNKGLSLTLDIAPEALGSYIGDPTRLRQVLFNLISNAIKFTEHGGIAIHACRGDHVGEAGTDEGQLIIAVADTGAGIPPGKAEALFAKFTQGDASTTRQHGGTGLGLSICRELCGLMGGEISASSRVGQGATFTVALPLPKVITLPGLGSPRRGDTPADDLAVWDLTEVAPSPSFPPQSSPVPGEVAQRAGGVGVARDAGGEGGERSEAGGKAPEATPPTPSFPPLHGEGGERSETGGQAPISIPEPQAQPAPDPLPVRILAAEDNPTNQRVLKAILAQAGIEPTVVANGHEAVEAWVIEPYDLILMDIHMPVMDGIEALTEIRRREAVTGRARTPIIALTANAMSHQVEGLLRDGFDAHVSKPIEVAVLFGAIEGALVGGEQPVTSRVGTISSRA